jgi:hypothetical protein
MNQPTLYESLEVRLNRLEAQVNTIQDSMAANDELNTASGVKIMRLTPEDLEAAERHGHIKKTSDYRG